MILDGGERIDLRDHFQQKAAAGLAQGWFFMGVTDPFGLELLEFMLAINGGREMETSGQEGLRDLACSMAVLESSASGCAVRLADVLAGSIDDYQREINEPYGL